MKHYVFIEQGTSKGFVEALNEAAENGYSPIKVEFPQPYQASEWREWTDYRALMEKEVGLDPE